MSENNKPYMETVERYCHIIGKNRMISRYKQNGIDCFECSNKEECEKNGGCKYGVQKKEGV